MTDAPADAQAETVWPLFLTAHALLVERVEATLAAADLPSLAWYDLLWALERTPDGRARPSDLAASMVLSRSNTTRLIDRLERAALVGREAAVEDGRGSYVVLTAAGRALRARMWPVYRAAIAALFEDHLQPEENRAMAAALRRVLAAVRG